MIVHDVEQGSPEWIDLRKGIPTASEFSSIITAAKADLSKGSKGYICRLIGSLTDQFLPPNVEHFTSRHTEWGTNTEGEARRFYSMEGNEVKQVGFITTDDGRFGCSPDGLLISDCGEIVGGLELKCPTAGVHLEYLVDGELPLDYKQQCHGALAVTGLPYWDFLSYCPGNPPFLIRVYPDEYTEKLKKALEIFWEEYMTTLIRLQIFPEKLAPFVKAYAERKLAEKTEDDCHPDQTNTNLSTPTNLTDQEIKPIRLNKRKIS